VLPDSHILVYPIPALDGSVTEGQSPDQHRLVRQRGPGAPLDALNDRPGRRAPAGLAAAWRGHRTRRSAGCGRPPGIRSPAIAEAVVRAAERSLQVVTDIEVPRMAFGRICLIGDAAFAVRPHAAAGTAKAAADGWALAEELAAADGDGPRRAGRLGAPAARARPRPAGPLPGDRRTARSSWARSGPGDPRLIFGLYSPGN